MTVASSFTNPSAPVFGAFDTLQKTPVVSQPSTTGFKIPGMPSPTAPTSQPNAMFGSSNLPSAPKTSIFGSASAGFGLGQTNTEIPPATTTNTQTATFGATPSVTSTFNFGSTTSAAPPTFGQNSNRIFNNSAAAPNPQPSGGGFSFKPPTTTNQTQGSTGGFSFSSGGGNQGSNEAQKGSVFSRLGPTGSTTKPTSVVSPSKSLFTFTNTPPANNEKVGAATTQPAFGANMTNVSNISQTSSIFGGNTTMNNSTAQNTTIFGIGSTTNNPSESSNLFGGSQNTPQQPQGNDGLSGLSQIFNSAPAPNQASGFQSNMGFGSSINPAPPVSGTGFGSNVTPVAPVSGTGFGQKSSFNFGASNTNNNNNNNATSAPFTFGQSSAPAPDNSKPFAFGGASSPPAYPGSQDSQGSQEPPKFNFTSQGGNNSPFGQQPNNNNNNATPTFGSASITPSPGAFNFSTVGNNNNVFGGGGSDGSTGSSSGAFNFTANQGGPVAPPGQGGLAFNIGTGGQQQGRRQMRTGTRRLNK